VKFLSDLPRILTLGTDAIHCTITQEALTNPPHGHATGWTSRWITRNTDFVAHHRQWLGLAHAAPSAREWAETHEYRADMIGASFDITSNQPPLRNRCGSQKAK